MLKSLYPLQLGWDFFGLSLLINAVGYLHSKSIAAVTPLFFLEAKTTRIFEG